MWRDTMKESIDRHWACGCPIGDENCAYQKQEQDKDFGWWWHLAGQQAVKQEVEVSDE